MKMNNKIKAHKTTAYLGSAYVTRGMNDREVTHNKGITIDANKLSSNGFYVVTGHGSGYYIPTKNFTKYVETWKEVETLVENGAKVEKITAKSKEVTADWLAHFARIDAEKLERAKKVERRDLRARNTLLRKKIHDVKTGKAEKELAENLRKLS